jgi:hypothetical protein
MKTTLTIEKYELRISAAMNLIGQIQKDLLRMNGIRSFSSVNPAKLKGALIKLGAAHKNLYDAIGLLLESGNKNKEAKKANGDWLFPGK